MSVVTSVSCCTDRLHLKTNNITDTRNSFFFGISRVYHYKFHTRLSPILSLFTEILTTIFQWQGAKVRIDDNALSERKTIHKNRSQDLNGRTNRIHLQLPSGFSAAARHLKRPSLPLKYDKWRKFSTLNVFYIVRRECSQFQHQRYRR
jgi:hypothetical protein